MGFLERRRQKRDAERTEKEIAHIRQAMAGDSDFQRYGDGALRTLVVQMWNADITSSMHVLRQLWKSPGGERSGRALYDSEFKRHWIGLDQEARADELVKLIQWQNMDVESDEPMVMLINALVDEKVRLLAWAHDQTYGTDYVERIYRDPLQFGVHEMSN